MGSDVGHSVVMRSMTEKTITKIGGEVIHKSIYRVMDPGVGGIVRMSASKLSNHFSVTYLYR
jgi:hypothetical protein